MFMPSLPIDDLSVNTTGLRIETPAPISHSLTLDPQCNWRPHNQRSNMQTIDPYTVSSRQHTCNELRKLHQLTKNWDNYDAEPIAKACVDKAVTLIMALPAAIPEPDITPNPNGTVTLEWEANDRIFSIELGDVEYSAFMEHTDKTDYRQGTFDGEFHAYVSQSLTAVYPERQTNDYSLNQVIIGQYDRHLICQRT